MIIDCHTHIFPDEVRKDREASAEGMKDFPPFIKIQKQGWQALKI